MRIQKLIIKGFRCFDDLGATISFDNFTCFIGANAAGKTAAMQAIVKLFGETASLRQISNTDFHLDFGENLTDKSKRTLSIDCYLTCPNPSTDRATSDIFDHMCVDKNGELYCRIRLDATWIDNGTLEGDVSQELKWIFNEDGNDIYPVDPRTRAKIKIAYIPAVRNPEHQIHSLASTGLGQILKLIKLDSINEKTEGIIGKIQEALNKLPGIESINTKLQEEWDKLYDGYFAEKVNLGAFEEKTIRLLNMLDPYFSPAEGCQRIGIKELSDGLRSLFSISLVASILHLQDDLSKNLLNGFDSPQSEQLPILTIVALEEPENHLSPHYLGKIINEYTTLADNELAQVIISSHSPSILRRILPDNIRFFYGNEKKRNSSVKNIPLPDKSSGDEIYKYVREALQSYPELYFSHLVVLGEGPSEEIVLKKVFQESDISLDENFISIVPLGGRHVNYLWKLLNGLNIPFITLLDFDLGKGHGGWRRIQYIRDQLIKLYGKDSAHLKYYSLEGTEKSLADKELDNYFLNKEYDEISTEGLEWLKFFKDSFSIFFSYPLDIDLAMLEVFQDEYKSIIHDDRKKGPIIPDESDSKFLSECTNRMKQVLSSTPQDLTQTLIDKYSEEQIKLFPWYKYLFVEGSKPATHMRAIMKIDDLYEKMPEYLYDLTCKAEDLLENNPSEDK